MSRLHAILCTLISILVLGTTARAQWLITIDGFTDKLIAFDAVDGKLVNYDVFSLPVTTMVAAIEVGNEVWVSQQTADSIVRYDHHGNVLGTMGPTLAGGGMDNIRGMVATGGVVYVTNDGTANGATANSLVTFDYAGNYLGTLALSKSD
jgi:hypothetical protein